MIHAVRTDIVLWGNGVGKVSIKPKVGETLYINRVPIYINSAWIWTLIHKVFYIICFNSFVVDLHNGTYIRW